MLKQFQNKDWQTVWINPDYVIAVEMGDVAMKEGTAMVQPTTVIHLSDTMQRVVIGELQYVIDKLNGIEK